MVREMVLACLAHAEVHCHFTWRFHSLVTMVGRPNLCADELCCIGPGVHLGLVLLF